MPILTKRIWIITVILILHTLGLTFFFNWLVADEAFAVIGAWLDYTYTELDSKATEKATGSDTETQANSFRQLYGLDLNRNIYPNLRFRGNFIADTTKSDTTQETTTDAITSRTDADSRRTTLRPFLDLTLRTPPYLLSGTMGYRKEKVKTSQGDEVTTYNIVKTAVFGWRPEDLPSIEVRYRRTDNYDEDRDFQDTDDDNVSLESRYAPIKEVELRYRGTYDNVVNNVSDTEQTNTSQSGEVIFARQFFGRADIFGSYETVYRTTKLRSSGTGSLDTQVFPVQGLSSVNDIPETGSLNPNPALIDGDRNLSAGINLGSALPAGGDNRLRNIGLDLSGTSREPRVDKLFVTVQQDLTGTVADSFRWEVFVSDDNQNWDSWRPPSSALYDPFLQRFEINFPSVESRYIKIAVRPLSPTVVGATSFPDIFVTEMEAFEISSAKDKTTKIDSTKQTVNFSAKTRLTENPFLFYELTYYYNELSRDSITSKEWTLSNGFSATHRFTSKLDGFARVAREDTRRRNDEDITAYVYTYSFAAVPLPTLRNNFNFSGRYEENPLGRSVENGIYLSNTAQLYVGVDMYLNGGYSRGINETDQENNTRSILTGMSIVPHRTTNIQISYSDSETKLKGGGEPESKSFTKRATGGVSYSPLTTLHLFAELGWTETETRSDTTQNYSLGWAPFPGGRLEFGFSYREELRSQDNTKIRRTSPRIRWNIRRGTFLDISYFIVDSESDIATEDSQVFTVQLRAALL